MTAPRRKHMLICIGDTESAGDVHGICDELAHDYDLRIICTKDSIPFFDRVSLSVNYPLYIDEDDSRDVVPDILDWAEGMLLVPLSSKQLAELSGGYYADLVSKVVHAWGEEKPIIAMPDFDERLSKHPVTKEQLKTLEDKGVTLLLSQNRAALMATIGKLV